MKVFKLILLCIIFVALVVQSKVSLVHSNNINCDELMSTYSCWHLSWNLKRLLECLQYNKQEAPASLVDSFPVPVQIDFLTLSLERFDTKTEVSFSNILNHKVIFTHCS